MTAILVVAACSTAEDSAASTADSGRIATDTAETIDTGESEDTGPEDDGPSPEELRAFEELYDPGVVQVVELTITEEQLALFAADPDAWAEADLTLNGESWPGVGVRLRGDSEEESWDLGKPGFRLKFDEFGGDEVAGCKRMTLDGMVGDPAMVRTMLASQVWEASGLPAPRANYAVVSVNGELFGLYANIETVDKRFVGRRYDDDEGDLWEAHDSADFTASGVDNFEIVSGVGNVNPLKDAAYQVRSAGDDFVADVADVIDMNQFLAFWAVGIVTANRDGYPFAQDDFYLYADPADARFEFVPDAMDESFDTATATHWKYVSGVLAQQCYYYDETCDERFVSAAEAALATFDTLDAAALAEAAYALTETYVAEDPRKPELTSTVLTRRSLLSTRLETHSTTIRTALGL